MFRSRHTIALSTIVLYFIPILFLTIFGMGGMNSQKTWSFFSYGLFFGITGTLILFYLLIHFEASVNSEERTDQNDEESETDAQTEFEDQSESISNLENIIVNLNEDLDLKRRDIQHLSTENFNLKKLLEEKSEPVKKEPEIVQETPSSFHKVESISLKNPIEEIEELVKTNPEVAQELPLTFHKIEQYQLARENKVEVTRL